MCLVLILEKTGINKKYQSLYILYYTVQGCPGLVILGNPGTVYCTSPDLIISLLIKHEVQSLYFSCFSNSCGNFSLIHHLMASDAGFPLEDLSSIHFLASSSLSVSLRTTLKVFGVGRVKPF